MVTKIEPSDDPELDAPSGNRTIIGSGLTDYLSGSAADDIILSGQGADLILAGGGDDYIDGGADQDFLIAGAGNDTAIGGAGNDSISAGDGVDLVSGGDGNDTVFGGAGADHLFGGAGDDTIFGGAGGDTLHSDSGSDTLQGGADNDTFILDPVLQGTSVDTIDGGAGTDQAQIRFFEIAPFQAFSDEVDAVGFVAALANIGFDVTGIENFQIVPVSLGPIVNGPLAADLAEDFGLFDLDLTQDISDPFRAGLTIENFRQTAGGGIDAQVTGAGFAIDPAQFSALVLGDTTAFSFAYDVVDGEGLSVTQTFDLSVTGANSPVVIDPASSVLTVDVPVAVGGGAISGFLSFDEFAVGTVEPISDGFVTLTTQQGGQQIRAQDFTQIEDVFEGQFFGLAVTTFFIDFEAPVGFVSFGLWDPNFDGGTVTALDVNGAVLEVQTFGQEIPTGPFGGSTSQLVTFTDPDGAISAIVVEPLGNDFLAIDQLTYGDAGASGVVAGRALIAFDDPDRIDTQGAEIVTAEFVGATAGLPAGLEAADLLDLTVREPGVTLSGQVSVDLLAETSLFDGLGAQDALALVAEIEISDAAGLSDRATVTFNLTPTSAGNQAPILLTGASTLTAEVTVDQVDPGLPSGVIDFEDQTIGGIEVVTDGFAVVAAGDSGGRIVESATQNEPALIDSGRQFSGDEGEISIVFDGPVDSVGLGVIAGLSSGATISIFDGSGALLESVSHADLTMAATVNGVGSARAYFSRDTAEIARVEISTVGDSTLGVDEIRYGFGDLLTPTTFATFRDLDGARFDDTFQTLAGTFEGTGAGNLAFDPNDFTIDDFGFFGDSTGPIATRETTLAIENNLFAFLAAGEEITAVLPTLYADGQSQTADAVFEYTFVGVNDAPTAVDDSAVTDEDTAIAVNFLSNDFDIDGGPFLIDAINGTSVSGTTFELPSGATIRFDDSGDIVYDPTGSATLQSLGAGQSFTDLFTYTIRDFGGLAASGTVDIRVSGLDDAAVGTANLISQFDPSGSGSLYSMSVSANSAEIAVVAQSSSTIDIYTPQGVFLRSLTLPGDIGNDGDLDFVPESFDLAGVTIPRGALLVMSGDSAEAEVFAIDPSDGEVLSTLNTVVGNSFTVGMAYNPVTATLFLLTCNCDSDGNVIVEVDPATGQELSRIELDPLNFQTFFGDLDVDPTTGDLIVVSSASTEILRLSSQGTVLERVDLPATVDGLSGVSVVRGDPLDIFVSSTSGSVFRLAEGVGANLGAVAVADLAQTDEATPVEIDIGANDTDPEGDALSFELVSSNGDGSADAVLDFVFTGTAPLPDTEALFDGDTGTFVSLPTGSSITVAFADEIVVDGQGDDFRIVEEFNAESARVEISADGITFLDIGVIDGTTAFDLADFGFSDRLFAVRITGLDDGGTFPFEGFDLVSVDAIGSFSAAPQGLVSEVDEGLVSYDPNGQFDDLNDGETRRDFFTYQVTDGGGEVSFAPVSVTVSGIGQSVITTGVDVLLSDDGLPVPISFDALLANDSDSDGDPLTIQSIATTSAFGAPITVSGNGASYDPGSFYDVISFGQQLTDTFTYVATDGDGNTAQGTVFVTLSGTNDPVTAVADVGSPGTGFTIDSPTSTGTPTGDGIGRSVASAGDVNGDGIGDLITGAPLATRGVTEGSGVAFVVFGSASTAPDVLDLSDIDDGGGFSITGLSENDALGTSVAGISDLNGDGTDDIAVSAPEAGTGGETYVIFGDESGFDPSFDLATLSGLNGFVFAGDNAFGQSGFSVAGAGDINGDGSDDLIIGAPLAGSGESYVIFGSDSGFPARLTPGDLTGANGFVISSSSGSSNAGVSVASAGDFNADGVDDLFIGASALDVGNAVAVGGGFILIGSTNGFGAEVSLETLTQGTGVTIQGFQPESEAGLSVAGIGDFNGDDVDDVIIGAPGTTTGNGIVSGQSYVLFGAGAGLPGTIDLQALSGDDGFAISGLAAEDAAGLAVTGVGDVNGDGLDDIVVTAPGADPSGQVAAGSAYLIFGAESGFGGDLDLSGLNGRNGYVLEGFDALGTVGVSVSAAGDMNGDGIGDLMLGAPGADLLNRSSGQVYVVFGGLGLRVADGDADGVISLAGLFPGLKPNLITTEDTPLSILGDDLTANDLDADALDNLVVTGVDSVSANGATVSLDGQTITYDPSGAFDELDFGDLSVDTFSYTVSDPAGETDTALVAVVIAGEDDLFQTLSLPAPAVLDPGLTGLGLSAFATTALPADTPDTTAPDGVLKITGGSYSTLTLQMATWRANSDDIMPAEMGAVDLKVSLPFGGEVMFSNAFDAASVSESYRISPDAGVLNVDYTLEDVQRAIVASQPSDGDDQIIGTTGNDTLTGDFAGADVLSGLSGDDFYDIAMGSGWLVIDDVTAGGADTVRIAGLNSTEAVFGRSAGFSDDLIIDNGAGGQVMILNSLSDNFVGGVETVILDDATLSMGDLRALLLDQAATGGDDAIFGFATDDTITGGRGDDSLFGGDGSDRFVFAIGDGRDIIEDTGTGASDQDALVLEGRVFTEAAFSLTDATLGTLEIDFENGDQVTIVSGIGENAMVESIVFEDMIISSSVLDSLF